MTAQTISTPSWWPELSAVPTQMAHAVAAWLPCVTLETYPRFLNMMYHYTLDSEDRLRKAAEAAPDEGLRTFYQMLAEDEAPHYELARRDLAAFGLTPSAETPPEVVRFQRFWLGVEHHRPLAHLGALFALECVADELASAATSALGRLGLGPERASFVLVHLEVDEIHGGLCKEHCRRLGDVDLDSLLDGARESAIAWIDMHRCLLP